VETSQQKTSPSRPALVVIAGVWVLGALVFAWLLASVFPVSFREDDAGYLAWAAQASSPMAAWDLQGGILFGMFRPVVNLWWYGLYLIAGLETFYYHFTLGVVYALMLGAFVFAGSAIHVKRTGFLALLLWLGVFYFLQYVLFWFSGYVYLLETAFLAAAAGFAALAVRRTDWALPGVVGFHLLAVLTKEPAGLILPGIYLGLVLAFPSCWKNRRVLVTLFSVGAVGMAWVLLKPGLEGRLGILTALQNGEALDFLWTRWSFYAGYLAGGTGKLLWFGFAVGLVRAWAPAGYRKRDALAALAGALFLAITWNPPVALIALLGVSAMWAFKDRQVLPGLAWFWAPIFAVLLIDFQTRTYLFESSFGVSLVLAYALMPWISQAVALTRGCPLRLTIPGAAILCVIAGVGGWVAVSPKYDALRKVTSVRGNFSQLFKETTVAAKETPLIIVPDYADTGLDYETQVLRASDQIKAELQKPMRPGDLRTLFGILNPRLIILALGQDLPSNQKALMLLMTTHEVRWWEKLQAEGSIPSIALKEWNRDGQQAALILLQDASSIRKSSVQKH